LTWLAQIGSHASVAGPDSTLQLQPAQAIEQACARGGLLPTDLDPVEINEAFAAVGIVNARELGLDPAWVNVNGGAIALGHPLGMSGARITLHLAWSSRAAAEGSAPPHCAAAARVKHCCCASPTVQPTPSQSTQRPPIVRSTARRSGDLSGTGRLSRSITNARSPSASLTKGPDHDDRIRAW
jgi:hypothetical protein